MNTLSIIIPTLNEAVVLPMTVSPLLDQSHEVIVVDGGSDDDTVSVARSNSLRVENFSPGRAGQMNRGAELASGETLLFLHADTLLPHLFPRAIHQTLSQPEVSAGAFRLRIHGEKKSYRLIEKLANFRSQKLGLPFGDQALFVQRSLFLEIGGYSDIPILEDLEIVRRLNRRGRVGLAKDYVITSARRWERLGPWKTTLINQLILIGYFAGVSPIHLARLYYRKKAL